MTSWFVESGCRWLPAAAMLLLLTPGASFARASIPPGVDPQQPLDFLAMLPLDGKQAELRPPSPALFASWTADQQRDYPAKLRLICASFWLFIHPPDGRLLPASVPDADERDVGVDVCVLGHMPRDWPDRAATLRATTAIFARQAGGVAVEYAVRDPSLA